MSSNNIVNKLYVSVLKYNYSLLNSDYSLRLIT